MNLPHVAVVVNDLGHVVVEVDDYELFDFIEDYLTEECNLLSEWVSSGEKGTPHAKWAMGFLAECAVELNEVLGRLDARELERIFLLNNPTE